MSSENQKLRSETIKQDILDAAIGIAVEKGFESLSVRKIAEQMKYSTGIIYYHFKDKQEIVKAIQMNQGKELKVRIEKAVLGKSTIYEQIRAAFYEVTKLAFYESKKYNLITLNIHSETMEDSEKSPMLLMLEGHLQEAVRRGEIVIQDTRYTAFSIWSSFLGFHISISQGRGLTMEEVEKMFDIQINMIFYGITNKREME